MGTDDSGSTDSCPTGAVIGLVLAAGYGALGIVVGAAGRVDGRLQAGL